MRVIRNDIGRQTVSWGKGERENSIEESRKELSETA